MILSCFQYSIIRIKVKKMRNRPRRRMHFRLFHKNVLNLEKNPIHFVPEGVLSSFWFQFCMFQQKEIASQLFQKKNFQILSKDGHDFQYKFQQILGKVEHDREQLPFISEENNYSKRSYGLFRCKSGLIMTSVQDFFRFYCWGHFQRGHFCAPPTKIGGTNGPTKIGIIYKKLTIESTYRKYPSKVHIRKMQSIQDQNLIL